MNLREAELLTAVARYGNITSAAKAFYMSQSALSHYISKVEKGLGVKLFDRNKSPLELTYAGEKYMEAAYEILHINEQLTRQFRDISKNMEGRLHIGMPRERGAYLLPLILPKFYEKYPKIKIQVFTDSVDELRKALRQRRIDLLIAPSYGEEFGQEFRTEKLFREKLFLIGNQSMLTPECFLKDHPNTIDLSAIAAFPFYLLYSTHASRYFINRLLRKNKIQPYIALESASNLTCCRLAATGLGISIVPEMTCRLLNPLEGELRCLIGHPPATWPIVACSRQDSYLGNVERDFIEMVRDTLAQMF